jgi:hypothetical protein
MTHSQFMAFKQPYPGVHTYGGIKRSIGQIQRINGCPDNLVVSNPDMREHQKDG